MVDPLHYKIWGERERQRERERERELTACHSVCTYMLMRILYHLPKVPIMNDSISCNFARCAVRHFIRAHMNEKLLPRGKMPEITLDYNHNFASVQGLQVTYGVAVKRFQAINKLFNKKWHPQQMKEAYLSVFSIDAWKIMSQEEREKHTLKECKVCKDKFAIRNNAFAVHVKRGKKPIAL